MAKIESVRELEAYKRIANCGLRIWDWGDGCGVVLRGLRVSCASRSFAPSCSKHPFVLQTPLLQDLGPHPR